MKKYLKITIFSFILALLFFGGNAYAASFKITASKSQVAPNESFTVSVGGDCIGRVNLTVSNGTLSTSSVWVEQNTQKVTVKAGGSGTVTITATPTAGFSDSDGEEYKPGAKSTKVTIAVPATTSKPVSKPSTPSTPAITAPTTTTQTTTTTNNNQGSANNSSKPNKTTSSKKDNQQTKQESKPVDTEEVPQEVTENNGENQELIQNPEENTENTVNQENQEHTEEQKTEESQEPKEVSYEQYQELEKKVHNKQIIIYILIVVLVISLIGNVCLSIIVLKLRKEKSDEKKS